MFSNLKQRLKDYIVELASTFVAKCQQDLYFIPKSNYDVKVLNDDFFQTTINVSRPIDFGIELDSFFCFLELENRDTNLSIVSIIPIDKNTYLVTFKQN